MFTLFHFGFEIFKIIVLAAVYSSVILILKFIITEIKKNSNLKRLKFRQVYFTTAFLLLVFSFTYSGDHGLGDEAAIPLGHWEKMNSSDGYAYFDLADKQISVDSFLVRNDHLCMTTENKFYDYHLVTQKWVRYNSIQDYDRYASAYHLPLVKEFKSFWPQYDAYWNGWRFWLLP